MRSLHLIVLAAGLALGSPLSSAAQEPDRQGAGASTSTHTVTTANQEKPGAKPRAEAEPPLGRWVRALTNVQVELTITDQTGSGAPEKKTVSMVVSSGNWGKIRSSGSMELGNGIIGVELNVDARPFVSVEGPIQLELTLNYVPPGLTVPGKDNATVRTGLNQSLTVVLQTGKPLIVSQSADPVGDRKIIIEAKATVLK